MMDDYRYSSLILTCGENHVRDTLRKCHTFSVLSHPVVMNCVPRTLLVRYEFCKWCIEMVVELALKLWAAGGAYITPGDDVDPRFVMRVLSCTLSWLRCLTNLASPRCSMRAYYRAFRKVTAMKEFWCDCGSLANARNPVYAVRFSSECNAVSGCLASNVRAMGVWPALCPRWDCPVAHFVTSPRCYPWMGSLCPWWKWESEEFDREQS
jgi:hypothetical protein